jgi:hypothetical protein
MSRWSVVLLAAASFVLGTRITQIWHNDPAEFAPPLPDANRFAIVTSSARMPLADIAAFEELANAHAPATPYWRSDVTAELRRLERIRHAEHAARSALLDLFGNSITDAAFLWRLFRPLDDRMPQLDSAEQIAIHDLEQQFIAESYGAESRTAFADHLLRVRERLGVATADVYALHMSPLANELRSAELNLSAGEFLAAFAALNALSEATSPEQSLAAHSSLRDVLGTRQAAEFRARRDPRYVQFAATARRFDLGPDKTMSAWTILLEGQDLMLAIMDKGQDVGTDARMRSQYTDIRRRLRELAGARAADALLQVAVLPRTDDEAPVEIR